MLAGAVVANRVQADELLTDRELDGVAHNRYLDLTAPVFVARPAN